MDGMVLHRLHRKSAVKIHSTHTDARHIHFAPVRLQQTKRTRAEIELVMKSQEWFYRRTEHTGDE